MAENDISANSLVISFLSNLTCNTPKPSSELNDTWISSLTPRVKSLILDFPPFDAADTRLVSRILPDTVTKTIKSRSPYDTVDDTDFQRACLKIKVLAQEAYRWFHNEIQELKDFENMYCEELIWCGEHKITFTKSIELYFAGDNYTALLLITSSLEQLLGDVLHLVNMSKSCETHITSQVPPLFRDLLLERPLADILGEDFVFLLRCLFGPPNSMNLRNIIWHGFICEEEFSPTPAIWYYCLIVVLAMSVCAKVKFSEASCEVLIRRHTKKAFTGLYHLPQNFNWDKADGVRGTTNYLTKSDFEQTYELILNECVLHSIPPHIHLLSILNQTFFVIPTTIPTWRRAFEYMYTGQPILFLILALPLLEHSLRRLYICLNQDVSDHRLCTGNVGEYFLTMDVMLRKSVSMQCDIAKVLAQKELVEERKNGIFDQLKGDVMDLLEDLFVHVSGPRLRDRIAHGDYDFTLLCTTSSAHNDPVFAHVVHLIRHLFERYIAGTHISPKKLVLNYKSRFHPMSLLQRECFYVVVCIWQVWKVARNDTRFELGIWGSSSDNSIVDLVKQCAKPILFSASFIKSLCEECPNAEDLIKDLDKFVSKDTKNRFSDHWCNTRLGKEDEKRIAFRRGALKKAANGLQKVYERLTSIGSSPSSRKRKNLQAFFVLLPILLTQLCDALSALMSTKDQKIMLESLIFVERWCSLCIKGSWEKFVETYNKFSEEISQIMRKKKVADELACDS